jgi:LPS export ABC transporter protein LptC
MRGVAGLLAVGATMTIAACQRGTKPPLVTEGGLADSADQILFDTRSILTNAGVKRGELFADTIFVFGDQTRYALRNVRANFNTEDGAPHGTMRGDRGTYDLRTQVLEGYGNVVVTSTKGERLTSPHLKYMQARNEISSDSAYVLVRGEETQRGIGFTSDPNLTVFKCKRACGGEALVPLGGLKNP